MNIIHEKLERLDQAILNDAAKSDLRGYIVDIRDYLAARQERDLTTELEILRSEYSALTREHEALKSQLKDTQLALEQATTPKNTTQENRPEPQHGLLVFINVHGNPPIRDIAHHIGMSEDGARFHLVELSEEQMVYAENFMDGRQNWCLGQAGKKYLHDRGLLR